MAVNQYLKYLTENDNRIGGGEKGRQVTRADLAAFVIEQLTTDTHVNRAVTIANS